MRPSTVRQGERVFVDTGAWIALALTRDPLHSRALPVWQELERKGARLYTSIPVVMETFTFLDRNATREAAVAWRKGLATLARLEVLECGRAVLADSWKWFDRADLAKLSSVDATSFVLMSQRKLRIAFTFDHHFAAAGFRLAM
jgi:predicted nucleic acid-binding protein